MILLSTSKDKGSLKKKPTFLLLEKNSGNSEDSKDIYTHVQLQNQKCHIASSFPVD